MTAIRYKNIPIETAIECCVFEVEFSVKTIVICIVYRNENFPLPQYFPELEELLHNLKAFKKETVLFGDSNIDTLKDSTERKKF